LLTRTPDRESSPPIEPNSSPGKRSSKLKKWYIVAAVGLLNGLLLFLVVNLALYAIMGAKRAPTPTLTPTEHLIATGCRRRIRVGERRMSRTC